MAEQDLERGETDTSGHVQEGRRRRRRRRRQRRRYRSHVSDVSDQSRYTSPPTSSTSESGHADRANYISTAQKQYIETLERRGALGSIEMLYRHNVLFCRAKLFKHFVLSRHGEINLDMLETMCEDLEKYSRAMEGYRSFRDRPGAFRYNKNIMRMGAQLAVLAQAELGNLPTNQEHPSVDIEAIKEEIVRFYCDKVLGRPYGVEGDVRMLHQTAMKASTSIRQLSFAVIIVDSTGLELMANSYPWLQLTQPLEGGEGSESDMSFATSTVSPELSTEEYFMTSSFDLEFEPAFSTPIPPFQTYDTNSQTLSFAEALLLTQIVDHEKEAASSFDAETQPQYCSLDMLSNKTLPPRQGLVDEAKDFTSVHASQACRYYGMDLTDSVSSGNTFEPSSALLLTYGKNNHCEPPQAIKGGLPPSRAQAITLDPTKTCMGDEDGSTCPLMFDSDDSSVEDIEVRKAFAYPYFRRDPVRHIECLSRKLYHRRLSPERQWHKIWETLFNLKLPREGPYLGGSKEEIVGSMIALLSGFQALSDERSNDMETEETEKASACGGVDSIPMTPQDMEFDFDFNIPLDRSPSPEIQNSYPSKDMTQMQESSSVTPTELSDYSTLKINKGDILVGHQSTKHMNQSVQVKHSWPPNAAVCTPKTFESSEMTCATSNIESAGKSLTCLTHVLEDREEPDPYEAASQLLRFGLQGKGHQRRLKALCLSQPDTEGAIPPVLRKY
ncbi:uncharacterized protein FTJAE_118 [Fusarium tjaetaba]|uniref:Uncharacterized protein n=1 Tax=Fusarium tjaetaba TaxID=1567544 RepID=A0A8H5SE25_9HYPO|nr:uncharacterized protein FTJAE_118 [Fusarium tjaetaba]KAF5651371.1 hypothetical protein FTJAE_118 [Fusarium tjaetaba]